MLSARRWRQRYHRYRGRECAKLLTSSILLHGVLRTLSAALTLTVSQFAMSGCSALPSIQFRLGELKMRAHQIMTRQVMTVETDTPIVDAANIMLNKHISGLPVVDEG